MVEWFLFTLQRQFKTIAIFLNPGSSLVVAAVTNKESEKKAGGTKSEW